MPIASKATKLISHQKSLLLLLAFFATSLITSCEYTQAIINNDQTYGLSPTIPIFTVTSTNSKQIFDTNDCNYCDAWTL